MTEQVDALRALAIDPTSFLLVPRFIGIVLTLFLSTVSSDALALVGASQAGWAMLGVEPSLFFQGVTGDLLGIGDIMHGLIKSVLFGVVIALSSCRFGAATEGGAPGVGPRRGHLGGGERGGDFRDRLFRQLHDQLSEGAQAQYQNEPVTFSAASLGPSSGRN